MKTKTAEMRILVSLNVDGANVIFAFGGDSGENCINTIGKRLEDEKVIVKHYSEPMDFLHMMLRVYQAELERELGEQT